MISRASLTASIAGAALCAVLLPLATAYYQQYYKWREPFFSAPVPLISETLKIRNDGYGKGYFGASRNGGRSHEGLDFVAKVGDPIYASKSGRVVFSGDSKGYGLCVDLRHPDGLMTRYAHLLALEVHIGDWVLQGQQIAKSGKTGNAANPRIISHLHFEIKKGETALNPLQHLLDPRLTIVDTKKGRP